VVDNVDPREDVDEELGVPGVTGSNTLNIRGDLGGAVQGLALLHLVNHLAHVPLDLPRVLGEAVETSCEPVSFSFRTQFIGIHTAGSLVKNVDATQNANGTGEAHDGGKATAADMRRASPLHDPECNGGDGSHATSHGIIGRPSVSEHATQVPRAIVSVELNMGEGFGEDRTGRSR
jgi:hypothetical protein